MKKSLFLSAILIAILALGFVACNNGTTRSSSPSTPPVAPTSVTYTSFDAEGAKYELVISRPPSASVRSTFTPVAGDLFILTRTLGNDTQTATGTVSKIDGTTFTLKQGDSEFALAVTGSTIASITGEIAITGGGTMTVPSGDLGAADPSATLSFSNEQVYTVEMSDAFKFEFTEFTESAAVTIWPSGGTGAISDGKLNFTIGVPGTICVYLENFNHGVHRVSQRKDDFLD